MIENTDLTFAVLGTILGFISGFVPGVGNVVMMILTFPIITNASLFQMLLFYLVLTSASQFSGSIVATVFGVPGETSSMPAVIEGNRMFNRGVGNFAISNAALGSVLGAFIALSIIFLLLPISIELIKNFYNNNVQIIILLITCFSVLILLGNSFWKSVLVFLIGFLLALIGFTDVPRMLFLEQIIPYTEYPKLRSGLPFFPVIVSLYMFPVLVTTYQQLKGYKTDKEYFDNNSFFEHLREFKNNLWSAIRGSMFGCIVGLIPHVGTSISSNLSYAIEKKLRIKRKTYNNKGDIKSLVSAETANNGTAMVGIMPLLLIGIPISASEAILLSFINANGYIIDYTTTITTGMFKNLALYFVVVNIMCFIFAWPAVRYVNYLKKVKVETLLIFTGITVVMLTYYVGNLTMDGMYYLLVMICLLPLGYLIRNSEPMILIIAFVLQDKILASVSVFYQIHFG